MCSRIQIYLVIVMATKKVDDVEILDLMGWHDCKSKTFEMLKHPLVKLDNTSVSVFNLRMKYPPKANHE